MRDILLKEHEGSAAVETTILTPLCYGMMLILLYFFFLCVSYIVFNNLATAIASEMNARVTGYVVDTSQRCPEITVCRTMEGSETESTTLDKDKIVIQNGSTSVNGNSSQIGNSNALAYTSFYILDKYKGGFAIPYNQVTGITITSGTELLSEASGRDNIGTLITVEITFRTSLIDSLVSPEFTARGYAIIN